ncbi:MAG TPA: glycosyl hydrolase [Paludibacteraceae bacterium]|jgi:mannan endo-1,4-beta-mannosidase|nr:glycosyl hydrolase [Paludibacteraceae bacterium]HOU68442.1 glycosyl hydrolase [Paludibacteraceae bacterium]HPH63352.1 glycosyl hydrolase [Paludibacteraceae bacterium]HQF50303.1 glycosyl hydrolase [Paludibacteraceae bacterium]HQJ90492.1 glycosyl hydrolase [Paludibacteraceae bacterium]
MKKLTLSLFTTGLSFLLIGCGGGTNKSTDKMNSDTIAPTEVLKAQLRSVQGKGILFGQHDALSYGIGWNAARDGIFDRSDIKTVTGSHPALFSWDLGHIDDTMNLDSVPFDSIRAYIIHAYKIGGINTISWHERNPITNENAWSKPDSTTNVHNFIPGGSKVELFNQKLDKVAAFLNSLQIDGKKIPVIFRPWHEMDGSWFWWGNDNCSHDDYKALYRHTINYLRSKGVDNMVTAYSPDRNFFTEEEYLQWYPGDDIVDIVGMDNYSDFTEHKLDDIVKKLEIVVEYAKKHNKIPAMTECGSERLAIDNWYTTNLLKVITATEKTRQIAYAQVWRNHRMEHFYVPFKGHTQEQDFVTFANDSHIMLLDKFNQFKAGK